MNLDHWLWKYHPRGIGRDQIIGELVIPTSATGLVRLIMSNPILQDRATGPLSWSAKSAGMTSNLPRFATFDSKVAMYTSSGSMVVSLYPHKDTSTFASMFMVKLKGSQLISKLTGSS